MSEIILKTKNKNYTKADLDELGIEALSNLRHYCTRSINDISQKKNDFMNEYEGDIDSKEYWVRVNKYKKAMTYLQAAGQYIGDLLKQKRCNTHTKEQHWYYTFFAEAQKKLPARTIKKLSNITDEHCGYTLKEVLDGYSGI